VKVATYSPDYGRDFHRARVDSPDINAFVLGQKRIMEIGLKKNLIFENIVTYVNEAGGKLSAHETDIAVHVIMVEILNVSPRQKEFSYSIKECIKTIIQTVRQMLPQSTTVTDQARDIIRTFVGTKKRKMEYVEIRDVREEGPHKYLSETKTLPPGDIMSKCYSIRVNLCDSALTRMDVPLTLHICYIKSGDTMLRTKGSGGNMTVTHLIPLNNESKIMLYTSDFNRDEPNDAQIPMNFQVIQSQNTVTMFGLTLNCAEVLRLKMTAFATCGFLKYDLVELLVVLRIRCDQQPEGCEYGKFKFLNVRISNIDVEGKVCVWSVLYEKNEPKDGRTYIHHESIKCCDLETKYTETNDEIQHLFDKMQSNNLTYSVATGDPAADIIHSYLQANREMMENVGIQRMHVVDKPEFLPGQTDITPCTVVSRCYSLGLYLFYSSRYDTINAKSKLNICYMKSGGNDESKLVVYIEGFDPTRLDPEYIRDNLQEIKNENIMFDSKWNSWDFLRMKMTAYVVCGLLNYELVELLVSLSISCKKEANGYTYQGFKFLDVSVHSLSTMHKPQSLTWRVLYQKIGINEIYIHRISTRCRDSRRQPSVQAMLDFLKTNIQTPAQLQDADEEARKLDMLRRELLLQEIEERRRAQNTWNSSAISYGDERYEQSYEEMIRDTRKSTDI
jgi:hypothetical protein